MPLYQFTKAGTGEITRHDLVLGDDIRTLLNVGTYEVCRVEPEILSLPVTVTLAAIDPPLSLAPMFDGTVLIGLGQVPGTPTRNAPAFDATILIEE